MQTTLFQEIEHFARFNIELEASSENNSFEEDLSLSGYKESKILLSSSESSSSTSQLQIITAIFESVGSKPINNQFEITKQSLQNDIRTTLMIRNIPSIYKESILRNEINSLFSDKYDFFNVPQRMKGGFAFINLKSQKFTQEFYQIFQNRPWDYCKNQRCELTYAKEQKQQKAIPSKKITVQLYNRQHNVLNVINTQKQQLLK